MTIVLLVVVIVAIIASVGWIMNPEGMWWALVAWLFRSPANVEPSQAGYAIFRIANTLVAIGLGLLLFRLIFLVAAQ